MSVATASAVLRPRLTAAIAQAQPTLPVPMIPIFMDSSVAGCRRRRTSGSLPWNAGRLEQEPGTPLGLVDPVLDQAGAGHVVVLVADRVRLAQVRRQLLVVVAQLGKHIERRDEVCVVI